jgi:NAD(P)-dependent dehydrogenase (short-subunit alcohol dehydrogenase family)
MSASFEGKTAIVTGGTKGIGLACARGLLERGARVALVSRSLENLRAAKSALGSAGNKVCLVSADLVSSGDAARMAAQVQEELGTPHILINSAGAARRTPLFELTEADWRAAMDAKFFTYVNAMMACLPAMSSAGGGAVVNVIGMGGKVATPTHLPGGAANAALMLVTAGLANGYASSGVRVNAVNPGPTMTDRMKAGVTAEARHASISEEQAIQRMVKGLPLGRVAAPEEIANAVLFLASDEASYINGVNVSMDGAALATVV